MPTLADDPRLSGLTAPGTHGSWGEYLGRLWSRRQYLIHVPWNELRTQQMNTVLGNLWHLFNPILQIAVYALVFGVLLDVDRGVGNFVAFLAVGVFVFGYTQKAAVTGSQSIVRNRELLRSISFPRALLPITSVVTELLAFAPGVLVMLATALVTGEVPRWGWLLLPALVVLHTVFNTGVALVAARAASSFGDVKNVLPFVFRLLFYGSGVLFAAEAYIEHEWQRRIFLANPMFDLIELYRWAVLPPEKLGSDVLTISAGSQLASLAVWTVVVVIGGLLWFRRAEATYGG